jgi:hypothetical protein
MLWKPVAPVYPRLVTKVPGGLTPDEATKMRTRGHQLPPICKLGKASFLFFSRELVLLNFYEFWIYNIFHAPLVSGNHYLSFGLY